jgi:hypothetical protein
MHETIEAVWDIYIHTFYSTWDVESVNQLGLKLELDEWVGYFTNHFLPKRLFLALVAR